MIRLPHKVRRDENGVSVVEFALLSPVLCMLLLGLLDLGQRMYLMSVVQGTLFRAARKATIGDQTSAQIDTFVDGPAQGFLEERDDHDHQEVLFGFHRREGSSRRSPDTARRYGAYNAGTSAAHPGDCYEDTNSDWKRDDMGQTGLGQSDDIVFYQVSVTYPRVVPLGKFLGFSDNETVTANTVLRNQPYGAQIPSTPPVRCWEQ